MQQALTAGDHPVDRHTKRKDDDLEGLGAAKCFEGFPVEVWAIRIKESNPLRISAVQLRRQLLNQSVGEPDADVDLAVGYSVCGLPEGLSARLSPGRVSQIARNLMPLHLLMSALGA